MAKRRGSRKQNVNKALRSEIEGAIQGVIDNDWLSSRGKSTVKATLLPTFGMTHALVYKVNVHLELFAKYHAKDAQKEIEGYKLLFRSSARFAEHLLTPLSTELPNIWLTPFANATTLHERVYRVHTSNEQVQWIKELYTDFLNETTALWKQTRVPGPPDLKNIYRDRVWKSIRDVEKGLHLRDFSHLMIKVNAQDPVSFAELVDTFTKCLQESKINFTCTTHNDEHPKNILVDNEAQGRDPASWIIIDYVNAKEKADWILSIARMLIWWELSGILEQMKNDIEIQQSLDTGINLKDNILTVRYNETNLENLQLCTDLKQMVLTSAQDVAGSFGEDKLSWQRRLQLAKFALLFSFAAHGFLASQSLKKIDFTVPIMIGESLKQLHTFPFS